MLKISFIAIIKKKKKKEKKHTDCVDISGCIIIFLHPEKLFVVNIWTYAIPSNPRAMFYVCFVLTVNTPAKLKYKFNTSINLKVLIL